MGFFSKRRQRKLEKQITADAKNFAVAHEQWQKEEELINEMIEHVDLCIVGKFDEVFPDKNDYGFMLKANEFGVGLIQGAGYIELVKAPSQYTAGYGGVSFPLFAGIRLNTGRIKGKRIPGQESMSHTDTGTAFITNTRVMFQGQLRTHEWKFDKMMGMSHLPGGITTFAMTTRGKPAGIGYGDDVASVVQFRLELASALALGTLPRFRGELQVEKDKHAAEMPVPPVPIAPTS